MRGRKKAIVRQKFENPELQEISDNICDRHSHPDLTAFERMMFNMKVLIVAHENALSREVAANSRGAA